MKPSESSRRAIASALAVSVCLLSSCDPVINIAGANFPAWLLCAIIGGLGTAILRVLLLASDLDPYLWWRPGFYTCAAALIASTVWIVFFNRT